MQGKLYVDEDAESFGTAVRETEDETCAGRNAKMQPHYYKEEERVNYLNVAEASKETYNLKSSWSQCVAIIVLTLPKVKNMSIIH